MGTEMEKRWFTVNRWNDDAYMWLMTAFTALVVLGFCVAGEAVLTAWGM